MAKFLDLQKILSEFSSTREKYLFLESALKSSEKLTPEEHSKDCPVYHRASSTCIIPIAICVEDNFLPPKEVILHEEIQEVYLLDTTKRKIHHE